MKSGGDAVSPSRRIGAGGWGSGNSHDREELLVLHDVRLDFESLRGTVYALNGVSFSLRAREVLSLVGESGCGKSVTALTIMGLLQGPQVRIRGGEILFQGEDLLKKTEHEMVQLRGKSLAMVFQDPQSSLNPVFTIEKQMVAVVRAHTSLSKAAARETVEESLSVVGLPASRSIMTAYPHELSGGMRQRVCMGMALACDAPLLIADEPTTALDVTIQAQMLRLLRRLRDEKRVSQLLITHNMGVAAQASDRVAVMYAGDIVEVGAAEDVLVRGRHPYTNALRACLPTGSTAAHLKTIPGGVPDLLAPPTGCRFHPRCHLALDECATSKPPMLRVGNDHSVACHAVAAGGQEMRRV